jgi:hypothetical protein
MFSLEILCCSQSGHNIKNNLVKFGIYQILKKKSLYIIGYLLEDSLKKSGQFRPFSPWQIFFT